MRTVAVRVFWAEPRSAVLATISDDGTPHQTVMWFELQGDQIMMNTARGRIKDLDPHRDPGTSVCFEDGYRYLTLSGTATLDNDQRVAQAEVARLAHRYHTQAAAGRSIAQFQQQQRVTTRLNIGRVVANGFPS